MVGRAACALALCAIALSMIVSGATAADEFDRSFSGDGLATAQYSSGREIGYRGLAKIARAPSGKLLVAISTSKGGRLSDDVTVFRFTSDGHLDRTFSRDGKVDVHVPGTIETPVGIATMPGGAIAVAAENGFATEVIRLTRRGQLDRSFGSGGILGPSRTLGVDPCALAVDEAGRMLVAGSELQAGTGPSNRDFAITRLTPDGRIDPTFASHGVARIDFRLPAEAGYDSEDVARDMKLTTGGDIVVTGTTWGYGRSGVAVARLTPSGQLDESFGSEGHVYLGPDAGMASGGTAIAARPDGGVVVGGVARGDFSFTALTADGVLDTVFGGDGTALVDGGAKPAQADAIAATASGNVILVGSVRGPDSQDYALVRVGLAGTADPTFGRAGILRVRFSNEWDDADGILALPRGKIVVSGTVADDRIGLVRLWDI